MTKHFFKVIFVPVVVLMTLVGVGMSPVRSAQTNTTALENQKIAYVARAPGNFEIYTMNG